MEMSISSEKRLIRLKTLDRDVPPVTLHDKCDTFLHDICDVRDICTSCICMVSAEQKWLDFGYFFDLSGTSSRRLVLAASTSS